MDNEKQVSLKFTNKIVGGNELKAYEERLKMIYLYINGIKKGQKSFDRLKEELDGTTKETKEANKELDKTKEKIKNVFDYRPLARFSKQIIALSKQIFNLTTKYSELIENVNLLEVAYSRPDTGLKDYNEQVKETSQNVKNLINRMSELYGLDESRLTRSFGIFKQMANAMQLPADTAENLSEHLVKMSNDVASLYNLDLSRAENALQSALAGQVRPIRTATGADITEKTLQQTVDKLGLDKNIKQFSYVEKRLIMIISLTDQLKKSQGDYGRTIESTANQTRIMKEQWERVTRTFGQIFYPIVKKVLPYLNAILMVITKIFEIIAGITAKLFKIDDDFDYSNLAGISDATNDIIDGMDEAGASVDNLKDKLSGLRGFDKLNVITSPTDTSSSTTGGIDNRILDAFDKAFSEYDDMLKEVRMKALDIRDAILDWLGVTDGTYKNLKLIGTILGTISALKIFNTLKTLFTKSGLITSIMDNISTALSTLLSPVGLLIGALATLGYAIYDLYKNNEEFAKSINELLSGAFNFLIQVITDIFTTLNDLWQEYGQPISEAINEAIKSIEEIVLSLWEQFLQPIFEKVMNIVKDLWENTLSPMFKKVGEVIGELIEFILAFWNNALAPLINNLVNRFAPIFETVFSFVADIFGTTFKFIGGIINGFLDGIKGLLKFLTGVFTGDWNKAWEGIKDGFKGTFNVMITIAEGFINGVITLINHGIKAIWNGIKSLVNSLTGIVSGIAKIFGINLDLSIKANAPQIGLVSIPRLKTGIDFVPNDYYPAYLDYGERVLTKDENKEYTNYLKGMDNNSNKTTMNPTFIIQVGDEKIANVVLNNLQEMAKTNGKPIVIGG